MSILHLRAELIARTGNLKVMAVADYNTLPKHYKMWKKWRNKEDFQFLQVLPCRCGNSIDCTCEKNYFYRNKRWFFEEKYDLYISSPFKEDEYIQNIDNPLYKFDKDIKVSFDKELSEEALNLKKAAEKHFGSGLVKTSIKIAQVIATIENHELVEKTDLLEALTFIPRK
ncbi:MAG: hypothetical protein IE931_14630 [Sphingobacteriales bacterium]|nr:hypothetical protein [Sphingobacteriales bacterium]